jgi:hypothetical protein
MPPVIQKSVNEWLVPALLGLICVLLGLGGGQMLSALEGVRKDLSVYQLQTENRLTWLETSAHKRGDAK